MEPCWQKWLSFAVILGALVAPEARAGGGMSLVIRCATAVFHRAPSTPEFRTIEEAKEAVHAFVEDGKVDIEEHENAILSILALEPVFGNDALYRSSLREVLTRPPRRIISAADTNTFFASFASRPIPVQDAFIREVLDSIESKMTPSEIVHVDSAESMAKLRAFMKLVHLSPGEEPQALLILNNWMQLRESGVLQEAIREIILNMRGNTLLPATRRITDNRIGSQIGPMSADLGSQVAQALARFHFIQLPPDPLEAKVPKELRELVKTYGKYNNRETQLNRYVEKKEPGELTESELLYIVKKDDLLGYRGSYQDEWKSIHAKIRELGLGDYSDYGWRPQNLSTLFAAIVKTDRLSDPKHALRVVKKLRLYFGRKYIREYFKDKKYKRAVEAALYAVYRDLLIRSGLPADLGIPKGLLN